MSEATINQRLKFLIERLSTSVRAFSEAIGDSYSNTQNYIGTRQLAPKHEYLAKVINHYSDVNAQWLLTGQGEPFLSDPQIPSTNLNAKKISRSQFVASNQGKAVMNANEYEKDLTTARKDIERLQEQLATKDALLAAKDDIIAAKEEMLALLRGSHNRPN